jgi:rRNA maturation endonuclease Nob1
VIKRTYKLPRLIEYRCNACKKVFPVETLPEKCPICGAVLTEKGYHLYQDEIPPRRV